MKDSKKASIRKTSKDLKRKRVRQGYFRDNHKKEKDRGLNNGPKTTESFRERNPTPIYGGRERQLRHYPVSKVC
jgi:hypothetical protein